MRPRIYRTPEQMEQWNQHRRALERERKRRQRAKNKDAPRTPRKREDEVEPTLEELEATIREQMRNLPDWWFSEKVE